MTKRLSIIQLHHCHHNQSFAIKNRPYHLKYFSQNLLAIILEIKKNFRNKKKKKYRNSSVKQFK